jgi:hypothetical protein
VWQPQKATLALSLPFDIRWRGVLINIANHLRIYFTLKFFSLAAVKNLFMLL